MRRTHVGGGLVRIMNAGDRAFLMQPADPLDVPRLIDALAVASDDIEDTVPAAETVLVMLRSGADRGRVEQIVLDAFDSTESSSPSSAASEVILEIPVRYDGLDLEDVAAMSGGSVDDVIAMHTGRIWRCAFIGFAPGFGYLTSDGPKLEIPRRSRSRTSVPAGSVALAGEYSAVYPRSSPGGWHIIGTTETRMWNLERDVPNLLSPGSRVRFVAQR